MVIDLRVIHRSMKYKFVLELPIELQTTCFYKLIINATSLKFGINYQCLIGFELVLVSEPLIRSKSEIWFYNINQHTLLMN